MGLHGGDVGEGLEICGIIRFLWGRVIDMPFGLGLRV